MSAGGCRSPASLIESYEGEDTLYEGQRAAFVNFFFLEEDWWRVVGSSVASSLVCLLCGKAAEGGRFAE